MDDYTSFINLIKLDLSYNAILKIEGINSIENLRELYLSSNRIKIIENLPKNLNILDVGNNKIK